MTRTPDQSTQDLAGPSGTVTFLFTDIEGSTQLLGRLREEYARLLEDHLQILRSALSRWNGVEIDTQGDSIFAVFSRAIDAVICVMEAQRELASHSWPGGIELAVRMGLHTGEPLQVESGYIGMDVHRAARIAAAGHGQQVLLSQTTRDLVFQDLPKGATLRDLGEHKLKDIRFPQHIYQLDLEGLPAEFPPLKTLLTEEEPPTPGEPPYKGLQHFEESDAEWFFGREREVEGLLEALRKQRFLAVIGASGSGKSSILRAGLIPKWKTEEPIGRRAYLFSPSNHPLESLAICLTREESSVTSTATFIDDLRADSRSLHLYFKRLTLQGPGTEFILVVDQFEELFTQCRDEGDRQAFVDNLLVVISAVDSPAQVLIALRADFYSHLAQYAGIRTEVAKRQEYLGAMDANELRQAIEGPAQHGGWEFSPGLVDLILHDIGATEGHEPEPGALPLLSHALLETWKRRRGNLMNLRAYSEAGGVRGAIARTADRVYFGELTPSQQKIARDIFLRLTELGEGTQDTRRSVSVRELMPPEPERDARPVQEVLVKLANARLITTSADTVEVAHEALIREWPLLREWLAEDREGLRLHRRLTEAAGEWERLERDPGALYRGARLAQALEWVKENPGNLNTQEEAFLRSSQALAEREQAEREAQQQRELEAAQKLAEAERKRAQDQARAAVRLRRRALYLTGAVVLASLLAGAAFVFARSASNSSQVAQANLNSAQTAEARAVSQQSTAQAEAATRATAEANAVQQRRSAEEQADLAISRELAAAAVNNLDADPELSILLALEGLERSHTLEAESALHQAVLSTRIIANIPAHKGSVYGVTFSTGTETFASAGMDGTVKIWASGGFKDLSGGTPLMTIDNLIDFDVSFNTAGSTLAFSPDGSKIAGISHDQTARIWDASSGELLNTLIGHEGDVYSLAFDQAGGRLATSSADGTVAVWNVEDGQRVMTVPVTDSPVYIVSFTPDGQNLITGSEDARVRFWDLGAMPLRELFFIEVDYAVEGPPILLEFSSDGKRIAIGSGQVARIWELEELREDPQREPEFVLFGHQNAINGLKFTPEGSRIVTGSADGTAKVWDANTGQELITLAGGGGGINSLAIAPDGIHPLSAHQDGHIRLWDISAAGSHEWWTISPAYRASISRDGNRLATAHVTVEETGETEFQLWELSVSGARNIGGVTVTPGGGLTAIGFWPDLSRFVTVDENLSLKLWDPTSGQLLTSISMAEETSSIGHNDIAFGLTISPDGALIATGAMDGRVVLWDAGSGSPHLGLFGNGAPVGGLSFSSDGDLIAGAGFDGSGFIWDVETGELLQTVAGHERWVGNVKFSPDGRRLLTGSGDTTAKLWDVETGAELLALEGHTGAIFGLGYSPDGTRLATGSADGSAILWDASSGEALLDLPGLWLEFTPDGRGLMTISVTELVARGFYLDTELLIEHARARLTRALTPQECRQYLHTAECPGP